MRNGKCLHKLYKKQKRKKTILNLFYTKEFVTIKYFALCPELTISYKLRKNLLLTFSLLRTTKIRF